MSLPAIMQPRPVWEYFHEKLGIHPSDDFRGVCHFLPEVRLDQPVDMDDVVSAIGYNAFLGRTCCMHVVVNKPEYVTRQMVRQAFEFPFITCGCEVVVGLVDSTNDAALDFDKRLGFIEQCRIKDGGPYGDLVILSMARGSCRWIRLH